MTQNILIKAPCAFCNKIVEFYVDKDAYDKWQAGMLIQEAFPTLSVGRREFMISQICEQCFAKLQE